MYPKDHKMPAVDAVNASKSSSSAAEATTSAASHDDTDALLCHALPFSDEDEWDSQISMDVSDANTQKVKLRSHGADRKMKRKVDRKLNFLTIRRTAARVLLESCPGFRLTTSPTLKPTRPTAQFTDLPYEIMETIVSNLATSDITGHKQRAWQGRDWDTLTRSDRWRRLLVDSTPTTDLVNLMKVSRTLHQVVGVEVYSRLSKVDIQQGALRHMHQSKIDLLSRATRVVKMKCHNESECSGRQSRPFRETPIPIRHLDFTVTDYHHDACHLFNCPAALQLLPKTLVLWFTEDCHFNTGLADRYHPYQIQNLVVRLGKTSDWHDGSCDIRSIGTWFRPFIKSHSVVFIINNPYPETTREKFRRRDMRYNPEDNLHPWLSLLKRSLIEYSLDPDYAKDITIVNIGSVRSETLGLGEEFLDMDVGVDYKCEKCFAERRFEKLFRDEYDKVYLTHSQRVAKANFKFISFREYINSCETKDILSSFDEKYYSISDDNRIGVNGKVPRACRRCGHPEERFETKSEIEIRMKREQKRRVLLNIDWLVDFAAPRVNGSLPVIVTRYDNGVYNRAGPW